MEPGTCCIPGCGRVKAKKGYCRMHYTRVLRYNRVDNIRAPNGSGSYNAAQYKILTIDGERKYEHIHVAEQILGKPLPTGAVVHHFNEITFDNAPNNLVICPDQAYHLLLHRRMNERKT